MPVETKRKHSHPETTSQASTPKRQKTKHQTNGTVNGNGSPQLLSSPSRRPKNNTNNTNTTPSKSSNPASSTNGRVLRTPTRRQQSLFSTPSKGTTTAAANGTPSTAAGRKADRSAKKKSARLLIEQDEDDVAWDGAGRLAEEILDDDNEEVEEEEETGNRRGHGTRSAAGRKKDGAEATTETVEAESGAASPEKTPTTPKRRAGRPKGAKNKRSPTPEGELPPHERYFFQNRPIPAQTSNNTLKQVKLLTHEEYFEKLAQYVDPCKREKEYLLALHRRSFPQWYFELHENFNICLYGYGSKRVLLHQFADWLYHNNKFNNIPTIVVVNGHAPNLSIRSIFATIFTAVCDEDRHSSNLGTQPSEVLELLQSTLKSRSSQEPVFVLINSIDAPLLRRATNQALLARLAATPLVHILATGDTPNFSLMWDISLRDQFNFAFHDCTTFAPYNAEFDAIEEFHRLVGHRGGRIGGKEGVGFVLKSLPENARNLYRLLLTELISLLDDDHASDDEADAAAAGGGNGAAASNETGIEFRSLYQKASEEFIASSEMMFRTLLKEFHDHQMITSRIDSSGAEILGVPLSREEMEGVLEDLVLG